MASSPPSILLTSPRRPCRGGGAGSAGGNVVAGMAGPSRAGAPVSLLPVGEVLLVQEPHAFQGLSLDKHAGAVSVVAPGLLLVLPAVLLAASHLAGGAGPEGEPAPRRARGGWGGPAIYLWGG